MANHGCRPMDCFASRFVGSRVRGNDGWIRSFALPYEFGRRGRGLGRSLAVWWQEFDGSTETEIAQES